MPTCKNDNYKKYTGKEKSPKGRGWCPNAERLGRKRIGRDRNVWEIVKKWEKVKIDDSSSSALSKTSSIKNSSSALNLSFLKTKKKKKKKGKNKKNKKKKTKKNKVKDSQSIKYSKASKKEISKYIQKIYKLIKKKSKNWWNELSNNNKIVVIYKNNKAAWENNTLHKSLNNSNIKFILWLKHKDIGLDDFVRYVLNKVTIKHIEALITRDNVLEYILENNNIFLKKSKLYTKKDYIPLYSSRTKMDEKKIYKKLKKSTLIRNKMKEQGWFSLLF